MKKILLLFLATLFVFNTAHSQLVINEFMSSNNSTISDEDGDYSDWIELYNAGGDPLDLAGYGLSDDASTLDIWTFPSIELDAGEHLLLFASGKNRLGFGGGWETLIREGEIWWYENGQDVGDMDWILSSFDHMAWNSGPTSIGYDNHDEATLATTVNTPIISLYARKNFSISDLNSITDAVIHIDYDDSFVAYLNGQEIARSGIGTVGDRPAANQFGEDHESVMYEGGMPEAFTVEVSHLTEGENTLAIEVHNAESTSSDLVLIPFFSVYRNTAVSGTPPAILQLASGKRLHTHFKIKAGGESIYLSDQNGNVTDSIAGIALDGDISYGRTSDGAESFSYFYPSTPGSANSGGVNEIIQDKPAFSLEGGYFSGSLSVGLSSDAGGDIRYTTDGTDPTASSSIYNGAISVSSSTVIKARISESGKLPGPLITRSFIEESDVNDHGLPMISISADPDELFHDPQALFNYQPGDNEKQVYFELYDADRSLGFESNAGMKIFGNESGTGYDYQQSLALFARSRYGDGSFNYRIFREKNLDQFEAFILRNNNSEYALFDGVGQGLTQDILDVQAYQPVVVFINGEYWGILNMMEKLNEHYVAGNFGIDPDNVDFLNGFETSRPYYHPDWPIAGSIDNYAALTDFLRENSMSEAASFDMVKTMIDVDYFATYTNAEIYMDNHDWPGNNTKFWRERSASGKWRWIVFDLDAGLGAWTEGSARRNSLEMATEPFGPEHEETWPNPPWSTFILRSLLENEDFENLFIATMCDLMATNFKLSVAEAWVDQRFQLVENEISNHGRRWRESTDASHLAFEESLLKKFLSRRKDYVTDHYIDYFGLSGSMHELRLDVPDGGGIIKVNNRHIQRYPFTAEYFEELDITLTAIPNRGFEFQAWTGSDETDSAITVSMENAHNIGAVFKEIDGFERIKITELNYASSPDFNTGDWIEILNATDKTVDLSGWMITDKPGAGYLFPQGRELGPGQCLVVCNALADFHTFFPDVDAIGDFSFGLSKRGDRIRLYNKENMLVDVFEYKVVHPWPEIVHDATNAIALKNEYSNSSFYGNWKRSENNGSPGTFERDLSTSIQEEEVPLPFTLGVYPNPFTSRLTLHCVSEIRSDIRIVLSDMQGRIVKSISKLEVLSGHNSFDIETGDLDAGVYFISVHTPHGQYHTKVICVN